MKLLKPMTALILLTSVAILLAMTNCTTTKATQPTEQVVTVTPQEFQAGIEKGGVQLVDVRSSDEYSEGHIADAVNIDVQEPDFQAEATRVLQKDKKVYVYCRSGRRSLLAAEMLAKDGYTVVDLDGGILGWEKAGLPVVK